MVTRAPGAGERRSGAAGPLQGIGARRRREEWCDHGPDGKDTHGVRLSAALDSATPADQPVPA